MDVIEKEARILINSAKKRALKSGYKMSVTLDHILTRIYDQKNKCLLTEIPFEYEPKENHFRRPYAPSLDRIDSSKGYTKRNTRVVCYAANAAMNEWGENTLRRVASGYVMKNMSNMDGLHMTKDEINLLTQSQEIRDTKQTSIPSILVDISGHTRNIKYNVRELYRVLDLMQRGQAQRMDDIPHKLNQMLGNVNSVVKLCREPAT
jgi:hypothetical protein